MRRREFITLFSSTVIAWPLTAQAQQRALPIVAFINAGSADGSAPRSAGVAITATRRWTRSATSAGKRSYWPSSKWYSTVECPNSRLSWPANRRNSARRRTCDQRCRKARVQECLCPARANGTLGICEILACQPPDRRRPSELKSPHLGWSEIRAQGSALLQELERY
jgi:hypothetical protein